MRNQVVVPTSLADNTDDSPEWPFFEELRNQNCAAYPTRGAQMRFAEEGWNFRGNWRPGSGRKLPATPSELSGGGDIHHELAVYRGGAKGMIGRLLNARVMAPDWVLQFGNADEDGKERRLQILRGREIVWKGWQGEAENTSPYMRSELLKRVRDFYLMLQGHQRRS